MTRPRRLCPRNLCLALPLPRRGTRAVKEKICRRCTFAESDRFALAKESRAFSVCALTGRVPPESVAIVDSLAVAVCQDQATAGYAVADPRLPVKTEGSTERKRSQAQANAQSYDLPIFIHLLRGDHGHSCGLLLGIKTHSCHGQHERRAVLSSPESAPQDRQSRLLYRRWQHSEQRGLLLLRGTSA